jgi:hypothetical protein
MNMVGKKIKLTVRNERGIIQAMMNDFCSMTSMLNVWWWGS